MARPKKADRTAINARLNDEIIKRLEEYCEASGTTKTAVMEKALAMYLDRAEKAQQYMDELSEQPKEKHIKK